MEIWRETANYSWWVLPPWYWYFKLNIYIIRGVTSNYPKLWWLGTWILVSILVNTFSFTPPLVDSSMFVSLIGNGSHPLKHGPYLKLAFVYWTNVLGYPKHKKWWSSTFETSSRTFETWCVTCETCSISFETFTFGISASCSTMSSIFGFIFVSYFYGLATSCCSSWTCFEFCFNCIKKKIFFFAYVDAQSFVCKVKWCLQC